MTKGEVCLLTCKPDYAYGSGGIGPIPPNSTLVFEVELLGWTEDTDQSGAAVVKQLGFFLVVAIIGAILIYFYKLSSGPKRTI